MYLVIKAGYTQVAIPVTQDIGAIMQGMDKAIVVNEPNWQESQYKIDSKTSVTFTIVPDNLIGPAEPVIEQYKDDLHRAYQRESEERTKRQEIEKELITLKERFAPFLEEAEAISC